MIIVDVGCKGHEDEESIGPLIRAFKPRILYGFDPHPQLVNREEEIDGCVVVTRRIAAWTHDGRMPLYVKSSITGIDETGLRGKTDLVQCFNLVGFLEDVCADEVVFAGGEQVVLKIDAEGAEYPLLQAIHDRGVDRCLSMVLVEWHPEETAHGYYVEPEDRPKLDCLVLGWP